MSSICFIVHLWHKYQDQYFAVHQNVWILHHALYKAPVWEQHLKVLPAEKLPVQTLSTDAWSARITVDSEHFIMGRKILLRM